MEILLKSYQIYRLLEGRLTILQYSLRIRFKGLLFVVVHGLLIVVAPLVAEHGL